MLVIRHEVDVVGRLPDRGDVVRSGVRIHPGEVVGDDVDDQLGAVRVDRGRQLLDERREGRLIGRQHPLEVHVDAAVSVVVDRRDHLIDEHVDCAWIVEELISRRGVGRVVGE